MAFLSLDPSIEVLQPCSHSQDAFHRVTMLYKEPNSCVLKKSKTSGSYANVSVVTLVLIEVNNIQLINLVNNLRVIERILNKTHLKIKNHH